ncbi:V-type ATP synthase subunit D [Methanospirillum stamsii]|nr:V-type ATP synthase subunit D [Methanospirillum stamsii]
MQRAVISGVRPTRLELLRLRRRELIAQKGRDILQEKLDALVLEHSRLSVELERMAENIREQMAHAYENLKIAGVMTGWVHLSEIASSSRKIPEIFVTSTQVMGVRVPEVSRKSEDHTDCSRQNWGYSMVGTSGQVDEVSQRYEKLLSLILEYASLQGRADRLILEMNRTRRRVNALEHLVIPRLQGTMRYIEFRLEEREREDLFRRKRMKQIMEKKSQETAIPVISGA